jgi:hypothetical protein
MPQLPPSIITVPKFDVFPGEESDIWAAYTDSGINQSHAQPSRTRAVALQISALCEISSDLMSYFYNPIDLDKSKGKQSELKKLSEIHQRLESWRRNLPQELGPKEGGLPSMLVMQYDHFPSYDSLILMALQHVLPALIHPSLPTLFKVQPADLSTATKCIAPKTMHPSGSHDLQADAIIPTISWPSADMQRRGLYPAHCMHDPPLEPTRQKLPARHNPRSQAPRRDCRKLVMRSEDHRNPQRTYPEMEGRSARGSSFGLNTSADQVRHVGRNAAENSFAKGGEYVADKYFFAPPASHSATDKLLPPPRHIILQV